MPRINAEHLFQLSLSLINADERGYFGIDLFNTFGDRAQRDLFDDETGRRNQYSPGFPQARTGGFQRTGKITDNVRYFVVKKPINLVDGIIPYPDDYAYYNNLRVAFDNGDLYEQCEKCLQEKCNRLPDDPTIDLEEEMQAELDKVINAARGLVKIEVLDSDKITGRLSSKIKSLRPTTKLPIAEQLNTGFEVYPKDIGTAIMVYLKSPTEFKLVYKFDNDFNTEVYDSDNTIHPEWPIEVEGELATRIAKYHSQHMREQEALSITNNIEKDN